MANCSLKYPFNLPVYDAFYSFACVNVFESCACIAYFDLVTTILLMVVSIATNVQLKT